MPTAYEQFASTHDMNNPSAIAQWNASQGIIQPTLSKLQQLSIGLAQGTIKTQEDVNRLYGNEQYGNTVPEANAQTTRYTSNPIPPPKPVDPIETLSPEQRAEFSKQFSIALSRGQVTDQASVDAFKTQFASGAKTGYTPTLASTQAQAYGTPTGTSATTQNQLGSASNTSSPYYSRYSQSEQQASDYLNTFEKPKTEEEILAEKTKNAQSEIDAVNRYYDSLLLDQSRVNDTKEREANAQSVLQGLSGSTEAGVRKGQAESISAGENAKIQAQRAMQVQGIYRQIQTDAYNAAQDARKNARESATGILNMAEARDEKERATILAQQQKGVENAKLLASSGVDLASLAQKDPTTYQYLVDSAGGAQYLSALFTLNRRQEDVLDKKIEGGKYVVAYKNPLTGSVRVETVDLGLPVGYSKTVDAGDRILAIPDNWDGDPQNLITINKGLTPQQAQKVASTSPSGASTQYASDLDAIIGATKSIIPSKFGQENFDKQMQRARNEGDKINLVASVVLKNTDAQTKTDFANQAVGINQIDKAIKMVDDGVKTGALQAGTQYVYNLVGIDFDPKVSQINQLITSAIQPYRNSVTGAAWGDQEDAEYQSLFGSTKYSPAELKQRLVGAKNILVSKSATALNAYVNPMGYYQNPFESGNYQQQNNEQSGTQAIIDSLSEEEKQQLRNEGYDI